MTLAASILIPTHNHGPTLRYAIESACNQSISDIEILVVGDGVPDETRDLIRALQKQDERIQFFDRPKGPRHGEIYRHAALSRARGEIVCYLADDDLLLPDHVEHMAALLQNADFAHALPIQIAPDGNMHVLTIDLGQPAYRRLILEHENRIPLTGSAHRMDFYRQLPCGWRTTPPDTPTDLYMWRQILSVPGCRAKSGFLATYAHFPSPWRTNVSLHERCRELEIWRDDLSTEAGRAHYRHIVEMARIKAANSQVEQYVDLRHRCAQMEQAYHGLEQSLADRERTLADLERQLEVARSNLARAEGLVASAQRSEQRLVALETSRTWRLRNWLIQVPLLRRILAR